MANIFKNHIREEFNRNITNHLAIYEIVHDKLKKLERVRIEEIEEELNNRLEYIRLNPIEYDEDEAEMLYQLWKEDEALERKDEVERYFPKEIDGIETSYNENFRIYQTLLRSEFLYIYSIFESAIRRIAPSILNENKAQTRRENIESLSEKKVFILLCDMLYSEFMDNTGLKKNINIIRFLRNSIVHNNGILMKPYINDDSYDRLCKSILNVTNVYFKNNNIILTSSFINFEINTMNRILDLLFEKF